MIEPAGRLQVLPPYLFADLDRKKGELLARGVDVISFTVGDPDLPTPQPIVEAARRALGRAENHRYPDYAGSDEFRRAAAAWMKRRFAVDLDPRRQVLGLIGSKEGIAHLPLALLEPGDLVLCPEPGYPVYANATVLAGGRPEFMPLLAENDFLPDLSALDEKSLRPARLLWLNYPNNPTGAMAGVEFLTEAVNFCRQHELLLCCDAAYSEITLAGEPAPSVLQVPGAEQVAVEFHSLSKTFNMTGWRVGFAAGNAGALAALLSLKTNLDSGIFGALQEAAVAAWQAWPDIIQPTLDEYRRRARLLAEGLMRLGYRAAAPRATFYLWMAVPGGDDVGFTRRLLEQTGVLVTPGSGFGPSGRGYVRLCLTQPPERIAEALERLAGFVPEG